MLLKTSFLVFFICVSTREILVNGLKDSTTEFPVPASSTTTAAPSSTTPATTAAPTAPTSTTAPTTASTTPAPTSAPTSPKPTPVPTTPAPPKEYDWMVQDPKTKVVCILATMKISLSVPYNTSKGEQRLDIEVPENATGSGTCDNETQTLVLNLADSSTITFTFAMNRTTGNKFWLQNVEALLYPTLFPTNTTDKVIIVNNTNIKEFSTGVNQSYRCAIPPKIVLDQTPELVPNAKATLSLTKLQVEAFRSSNTTSFGPANDCSTDSDVVAITVGVLLIVLVVTVLAIYLISRRRSLHRGYLSM